VRLGAMILVIGIAKISFPTFSEFININAASRTKKGTPMGPVNLSCEWSPNINNTQCFELLSSRMKPSLRRWVFLGDSTMGHLFDMSSLRDILVHRAKDQIHDACPRDFSCEIRLANRCRLNEEFGLSYRHNQSWHPPNYTLGEGPILYGLKNPYCSDCSVCYSAMLVCTNRTNNNNRTCPDSVLQTLACGAYIAMEFARDVKIQSPQYATSQENIALGFLNSSTQWNQDSISSSFGPTACVISTGFHDIAVPNITKSLFIANVKWYLGLLHPACGHLIWLANTAPEARNPHRFPQTVNSTLEWNTAVRHLLENAPEWRHKSSFVDVFNASRTFPHQDHVHMDISWYEALGAMFASLIEAATLGD
jgi:hypothetical protein